MFPEEHRNYGVLEVCPGLGVRVHRTSTNYDYIYRSDVRDAYWTGGCTAIVVELTDGRRARYTGFNDYQWIYS